MRLRMAQPRRHARGAWRVHIVHVQTNEEKSFANFAEAVAFITRYVPLGDFSFKANVTANESDLG